MTIVEETVRRKCLLWTVAQNSYLPIKVCKKEFMECFCSATCCAYRRLPQDIFRRQCMIVITLQSSSPTTNTNRSLTQEINTFKSTNTQGEKKMFQNIHPQSVHSRHKLLRSIQTEIRGALAMARMSPGSHPCCFLPSTVQVQDLWMENRQVIPMFWRAI